MLEPIKRIAAIHDLSGVGKCSLTVALPIISASGVECACLPTALLSTHTGEFEGFTFKDLSEELLPISKHWHAEEITFNGIYSGYLASPAQELLLEKIIDEISNENTLIICDPVMADNGSYYSGFDDTMADAFRRLIKKAHIITPNITEAAFLTKTPYCSGPVHSKGYIAQLLSALASMGPRIVALTGVHLSENEVGAAVYDGESGETYYCMRPACNGTFYGTGDIFASAFTALVIRGAGIKLACEAAISLVSDSIERTAERGSPRRMGVDFEGALPNYIRRIEKIDFSRTL